MSSRPRLIATLICAGFLAIPGGSAVLWAQDEPPPPSSTVALVPGVLSAAAMVFSHDYDPARRAPVDTISTFASDVGRVVCFTRVLGAAEPTHVTHVWYHEGRTMAKVELKIGSPDYRTYSSKNILPAWTGQWEVKVLDAAGTVVEAATFRVE